MAVLKKLKRGDSFSFSAKFTDGADLPLTGIVDKLKCQIRDEKDKLISDMEIIEREGGDYLFQILDTSHFPIRTLYFDVQHTGIDGIIDSTPTYSISIERDISHD